MFTAIALLQHLAQTLSLYGASASSQPERSERSSRPKAMASNQARMQLYITIRPAVTATDRGVLGTETVSYTHLTLPTSDLV